MTLVSEIGPTHREPAVPGQNRRSSLVVAGIAGIAGIAVAVASAGTALAISGGGYRPHKMGCPTTAAATNHAHGPQPKGCHDFQILIRSGNHTYGEFGLNTTPSGQNLHSGDLVISPDGSANPRGGASGQALRIHIDTHYQPIPAGQCGVFDLLTYPIDLVTGGGCKLDPAAWALPTKMPTITPHLTMSGRSGGAPDLTHAQLYFGADDGLDSGEHDEPDGKHGTMTEQNGPSDGGAILVRWHPLAFAKWLPTVIKGMETGNFSALARNPVPFLSAGFGACADGICLAVESRRTESLRGGGGGGSGGRAGMKNRDVYNYDGKTWDPYNCSGESPAAEKQCRDATHKNEDAYLNNEAKHVYLEPGVQFFEDPDPNGSPLLPAYPLPAVYVGSCGITLGGGPLTFPASPITNHSGQLSLSPSKC